MNLALKQETQERWYQLECVDKLVEYCKQPRQRNDDGTLVRRNPLICLPTGTGKSHVIANFLKLALQVVPGTRVVMATHVKELIKQNANKLLDAWPMAPLGIYSAGLKSREIAQPIIFGGIQSLVGKFPIFGYRDFLIIDEAHLLADEGSYIKFIDELLLRNPYLIVIGLTATPYRMGLGLMTNGKIFTDIIYNLTDIDGFNRLIAEGYLCPLIPKRTATKLDVSNIGMSKGEYIQSELQEAVDKNDITLAAMSEFVYYGQNRNSWIVFASGIEHAEHICDMLNDRFNIESVVIHSKRSDTQNEQALKAWKRGDVRCAVNMNGLTTGVDHPALDYCGMMRPTMSTGLWVQMLGRLTRPFPGKENGLVMDFAGNTKRLGPINDPVIPRLKGKGSPGDAPVRVCPNCGTYNHARVPRCVVCDLEFTTDTKLTKYASTEELLRSDLPQIEIFDVDRVVYSKHISRATGRSSIKASYYCGLRTFYEWATVEGSGFSVKRGRDWFRQRYPSEPPATNDEVLMYASALRAPSRIRVWLNKKYPEVLLAEF